MGGGFLKLTTEWMGGCHLKTVSTAVSEAQAATSKWTAAGWALIALSNALGSVGSNVELAHVWPVGGSAAFVGAGTKSAAGLPADVALWSLAGSHAAEPEC